MRKRSLPLRGFLFALTLLALLSGSFAGSAEAGLRIPAAALVNTAELDRLLAQGDELEQQGRWGEALSHYEEAMRSFPDQPVLKQRMSAARIHFDLGRRYADSSFVRGLRELTERQALDLYSEVLLKIQTHYVLQPDWNALVGRGVLHLDVALSEKSFKKEHLQSVAADRLVAFRQELKRQMGSRVARNRHDARQLAAYTAQLASQHLGISPAAVVLEFTCGATAALDPYSTYLTADQLREVFSQIEGNFVGLGLELKADNQSLLIVTVIPDGPAHEAGIRAGDRIVSVNGRSTRDISTDAAADMLRGPEHSEVQVTLVNKQNVSRRLKLVRRRIEVPSIEDVKILDPALGVAYMRISSFQKTTSRDLDRALWKLHREGMRNLIIDLRGNPGGLLTASVEVADKFVTSGTIVSTRGRGTREDFDYKAHSIGTWRVPVCVLIDGDSASASEILAAAIRDSGRGTVIGQRSYGKGSVQGIFPLNTSKSGVRLTTARFYSPNGTPISGRGVQPNIVVRSAAKPDARTGRVPASEEDGTLQMALQVVQDHLSQRN